METIRLDRQQTVANLVLEHSECAEVFQRHRIDFCCRGDLSIEAAARDRKVDLEALVGELSRAVSSRRGARQGDARSLSTPALVAHIVSKHHAYLRRALPFVRTLAAKVSRVHGDHNPKLRELSAAVEDLSAKLEAHLDEEERQLFPMLTEKEPDPSVVAREFSSMVEEHLEVGRLLERVRAATEDFSIPEWACNSYRTLFSELEQLEADVFAHVHLENHVLRPRFVT